MNDYDNRAEKALDLEDVQVVSLEGGSVVLARLYRTTDSGVEIDAGRIPVATAGVHSPTDLEHALNTLGFEHDDVRRALSHELVGDSAVRAVSIAERQSGNAEILA